MLTVLDDPELRLVAMSVPGATLALDAEVWCDLETGNAGPHYSLGLVGPLGWWWLRWDDVGEHREFVARPLCNVPGPAPDHAPCGNPAGHAGGHRWGFEPRRIFTPRGGV